MDQSTNEQMREFSTQGTMVLMQPYYNSGKKTERQTTQNNLPLHTLPADSQIQPYTQRFQDLACSQEPILLTSSGGRMSTGGKGIRISSPSGGKVSDKMRREAAAKTNLKYSSGAKATRKVVESYKSTTVHDEEESVTVGAQAAGIDNSIFACKSTPALVTHHIGRNEKTRNTITYKLSAANA